MMNAGRTRSEHPGARFGLSALMERSLSEVLKSKNGMWQQYTNAVLGLCVIVAAFMSLAPTTAEWTLGVLGFAIMVLALWGAGSETATMTSAQRKHA